MGNLGIIELGFMIIGGIIGLVPIVGGILGILAFIKINRIEQVLKAKNIL